MSPRTNIFQSFPWLCVLLISAQVDPWGSLTSQPSSGSMLQARERCHLKNNKMGVRDCPPAYTHTVHTRAHRHTHTHTGTQICTNTYTHTFKNKPSLSCMGFQMALRSELAFQEHAEVLSWV